MKCLLVAAVFVVVVGQHLPSFQPDGYTDRHAGYTFEYHISHYTFVGRTATKCYIMDVTDDQYEKLQHLNERYQIEDQIVDMITHDRNIHSTNFGHLVSHHHDAILAAECRHHDLYLIDFFG